MTELAAYIIAVVIDISPGLVGGGGSLLILWRGSCAGYSWSLFIVGVTSLAGGTKADMNRLADFRSVSLFGIPSILTVFIARHFILPHIPEILFTLGAASG